MKKIITTLFIAGLIVSCNNESSGGVSTQSITELENDDQEAAYAYGMNIGQQVTQMNEAMKATEEDSMDYKLIEKGLNDYRSEEHTSELQSRGHLVCRLLLEKKNK